MYPLPKSPKNVKRPAIRSPLLNTFVAPGFFEPYFLGSEMPRSLETIMAKDIDPIKYETLVNMIKARASIIRP